MSSASIEISAPELESTLLRARQVATIGRSLAALRTGAKLGILEAPSVGLMADADDKQIELQAAQIRARRGVEMQRLSSTIGPAGAVRAPAGKVFAIWSEEQFTLDAFQLVKGQWRPRFPSQLRVNDRIYPDGYTVTPEDVYPFRHHAATARTIGNDLNDAAVPGAVYAYVPRGGSTVRYDITDEAYQVELLPEPPAGAALVRPDPDPEWRPVIFD